MLLLLWQYNCIWLLMILILSPPLREEGHEVAEGVCFKEEHREYEMRREYEKQDRGSSRPLVSEANVSKMPFL